MLKVGGFIVLQRVSTLLNGKTGEEAGPTISTSTGGFFIGQNSSGQYSRRNRRRN